ncbi:MAG TPA: response regulator [Longimicrobiales bacterium]|nr:response regulator [Longimicrobiales bacterium]
MNDREATLRAGMAAIWAKSLPHVREQLDLLERAAMALMDQSITDELRSEAEREAHRLAGSSGSFGFVEASPLARELETLLQGADPDPRRAAELALALRQLLDTEVLPAPPPLDIDQEEDEDLQARVLVVDDDETLAAALQVALADRRLPARAASTLKEARKALKKEKLEAILLDINLGEENGLDLLDDVAKKKGAKPAVFVMTASDQFTDRVEAVRRGARTFLQKPMAPGEMANAVRTLLEYSAPEKPRVLAVDDDKSITTLLKALLKKAGFTPSTLNEPLKFWDALKESKPDIVLLDYDMPELTGLDLLRVLRSDPRWQSLPVIFITSRNDSETLTTTFESGADDFIGKPIVNVELVARIKNRLERGRLTRQMAETDYLTGLMNRVTCEETLRFYEKLAERYSQPLSIALLDIDSFTALNETRGHAAGDDVLRAFADLLRTTFRGEDVLARWAGAHFIIGMYGMGRTDAVHRLGEMLEGMQQRARLYPSADGIEVTFSAGVAQFGADGRDFRAILKSAEAALGHAREAGGARIRSAGITDDRTIDVMVVEDDDSIAELLNHALETRGYQVHRVADGQAALDHTIGDKGRIRPRVVLLDVDLPGVDGISVLRRWKQEGLLNQMSVIMLTVRYGETEVVETLRLGAFDHVAKPFSTSVLMQRIRRALQT